MRIRIHLKCWIRIRIQIRIQILLIRIHNTVLYSDVNFILQPPWTAVQPLLQDDAQEWLIPVWHDISFT